MTDRVFQAALDAYKPAQGTQTSHQALTVENMGAAAAHVADVAANERAVTMRHADCNCYRWVRVQAAAAGQRPARDGRTRGDRMPGGAYSALSGMRMRLDDLDRLAADLANVGTAGYKTERTSTEEARRAFASALDSAIDVTHGGTEDQLRRRSDCVDRDAISTWRSRDRGSSRSKRQAACATRAAGSFKVQADGLLTTMDDMPVQGESGEIHVPVGPVTVMADGTIRVSQTDAGKVKVVRFENEDGLVRESGTRFRAPDGIEATEVEDARIFAGSLEQSNVSVVERVAVMTEVSRAFEALQKGISVLMNEIDGRAIIGVRAEVAVGGESAGSDRACTTGQQSAARGKGSAMIRALYTAASGMNAQQANIDNVAHNLANVNTTGFKKSRVEFEDLVYQQLKAPGTATSQETEAPMGLEAGLGSRPVATARNFTSGNLRATNSPLDLAIEGAGIPAGHADGRSDRIHASGQSSPERSRVSS